ncbi:MAG: 16S rRNA (cytidine(1402)-2'-O)-methyltransferase [Chloroflexi bacterium]|nr:16S rRNA (cytidine(1402)-2'-O)-methyltransferase [Chloroflexota bacterium]
MAGIGKLYIIATPIGNLKDITVRALETLRSVDFIVCEEIRQGSKLLNRLDVQPKQLLNVNEHNEASQIDDVLQLLYAGKDGALISDCGTPVFSDPGAFLIERAVQSGITIVPIPGPSSLMAALSVLNFKPEQFYFAGFLPRDNQDRKTQLNQLKSTNVPIILMDTPYRLVKLLEETSAAFGPGRQATLACDISLASEKIYRGTLGEIKEQVGEKKAEFILILHAQKPSRK